jgi:hypothetical protein
MQIAIDPLKPIGYYMYHQVFSVEMFYILPTQCVYVSCMALWTNNVYFPGFCNWDGLCLLRGTS